MDIFKHISQIYCPVEKASWAGPASYSEVRLGVGVEVGVTAARAAILIVVTKGDSRLQVVLDSLGLSRVAPKCVVRNAKAKL